MRGRRHVRRRRDGAQEGPCRAPDIRWRPIASNGRGAHVARTESRRSDARDGRQRRLPAAPCTHTLGQFPPVPLQASRKLDWLSSCLTSLAQVVSNLLVNAAKYTPPGRQDRADRTAGRRIRQAEAGLAIQAPTHTLSASTAFAPPNANEFESIVRTWTPRRATFGE